MVVKPGYKQTEVGVIPKDWEVSALKDLIVQSRRIRYGILQPGKYDPHGRFMIKGQDYVNGWVSLTEIFRVSAQIEEKYRNARVIKGDLILTVAGSAGFVEIIPDWLDGANLTQATARITIDINKANNYYCKYLLQSNCGKDQVSIYVKGAAQPDLNCGDIYKLLIPHPTSLNEQHTIVTALTDADAHISSLDKVIAKKRDLKQAAMQELLTGKRRLPGFIDNWERRELSDLAEVIDPHPSHRAPKIDNDGIPFVGIGDISVDGYIDRSNIRLVKQEVIDEHKKRYCLDDNLVGISRVASIGKVVKLRSDIGDYVISPTIAILKAINVIADMLFYCLQTRLVTEQFDRIKRGSTRQSIGIHSLKTISIWLPREIQEQRAIAAILSDMDAEIVALEQQRDKTRAIKQGMMQELLTGRIRLT